MVQVGAPSQEVHGNRAEPVADGIALPAEFDAGVGGKVGEAQFAQQDVQPAFPGHACGRGIGRDVDAGLELLPLFQQVLPDARCLPADGFARLQPVGLRADAGDVGIAGVDPADDVGWQQATDDLQRREGLGHREPPCAAGR